jgi:HEAT repeat protein
MTLARIAVAATFFLALGHSALADTIWLDTGVKIEGVVTKRDDGLYSIKADNRVLVYRAEEVVAIEKNERTGALNMEEVQARWAEQDAALVAATGLNAEQRRAIEALLAELQQDDPSVRVKARDKLVGMQQQMDVFRYLEFLYPEASHLLAPPLIEVLAIIDAARAKPLITGALTHSFYGIRVHAIELLARMGDTTAVPQIARGLVDHNHEVRIAAAVALGTLGARNATLPLIENLKHADLRVSNSAREALKMVWGLDATQSPETVQDWESLWEQSGSGVANKIALADLQPLIAPEEEFQNE